MVNYKNLNRDSNVKQYEVGADYIKVKFNDNQTYTYKNSYASQRHVDKMKLLASQGFGLNAYINLNVKKLYSAKN